MSRKKYKVVLCKKLKYKRCGQASKITLLCLRKKGEIHMNATVERYCTIAESIRESTKQIKEYNDGKRKFISLRDSKAKWNQWIQETENDTK
jgi:hypothetical protein